MNTNENALALKLLVANGLGNIGKTTFSKHCLKPLLGAFWVEIENLNSGDGKPDSRIKPRDFRKFAATFTLDDRSYVVDVGSSCYMETLEHLKELGSTRQAFDFVVVPTVVGIRACADTLKTTYELINVGFQPEQIVIIPQLIDYPESFEEDFVELLREIKDSGIHFCHQPVLKSGVFELLKGKNTSVFDILRTPPNFKAEFRAAAGNLEKQQEIQTRNLIFDLSTFTASNLRAVFDATPFAAYSKELEEVI